MLKILKIFTRYKTKILLFWNAHLFGTDKTKRKCDHRTREGHILCFANLMTVRVFLPVNHSAYRLYARSLPRFVSANSVTSGGRSGQREQWHFHSVASRMRSNYPNTIIHQQPKRRLWHGFGNVSNSVAGLLPEQPTSNSTFKTLHSLKIACLLSHIIFT